MESAERKLPPGLGPSSLRDSVGSKHFSRTDDLAPAGGKIVFARNPSAFVGWVEISPQCRLLGRGELSSRPQPLAARSLSPGFLPGAFSSWSASPAPAALYSTLASRRSLYSRLSMGRSRERSLVSTCRDLGYAQGSSFWALRVEKGKLGLKGMCLAEGRTVSVVSPVSLDGKE